MGNGELIEFRQVFANFADDYIGIIITGKQPGFVFFRNWLCVVCKIVDFRWLKMRKNGSIKFVK